MNDPHFIANQFVFPSQVENVEVYGNGIINDTFVVTFTNPPPSDHARIGRRAILQRINAEVFPDPPSIMHNLALVLEHAVQQEQQMGREFFLPPIYKTQEFENYFKDENGQYWRAIGFIEQTVTSDILQSRKQAEEAGAALGTFHLMLRDIPVEQLKDTLPGFHDTPNYLREFDSVITASDYVKQSNENIDWCVQQIEQRRSLAGLLEDSGSSIRLGIMHGDPKLNNILFDDATGRAVSIIDLDTVKPGFIHYDIGDCIRSCCNKAGEMPANIDEVQFVVSDFEAILAGYLSSAISILTKYDLDILYDVVRLLPFELGLRFFTDYLSGNRYFKIKSADDNLYRARVQFQLLASIESQQQLIMDIVRRYQSKTP